MSETYTYALAPHGGCWCHMTGVHLVAERGCECPAGHHRPKTHSYESRSYVNPTPPSTSTHTPPTSHLLYYVTWIKKLHPCIKCITLVTRTCYACEFWRSQVSPHNGVTEEHKEHELVVVVVVGRNVLSRVIS